MAILAAPPHHAHAQHAAHQWEHLLLAAALGFVLLLFLGAALFATLSIVVSREVQSSRASSPLPVRLDDSTCGYGSVARQEDDSIATSRQFDSIFFDEDTYLDSGPPSPPSWTERPGKEGGDFETGEKNLNWSPVSTPQSALASSIATAVNERLAVLETELLVS